jgi:hypothetical protein
VALSRSRTVAAFTLLASLAFGAVSSAALAPEASALVSMSTLTVVDGPVVVRHGGTDFSVAHEGDVLAASDTIRTGTAGSAELTYFDGSSVRLDADAEIVIARIRADVNGATAIGAIRMLERTWNVVTKLVSGGTRYDVRTPSSTASVRG